MLAAESIEAAVEKVVRRRNGLRMMVLADACSHRLASTEIEPGRDRAGAPAGVDAGSVVRGRPLVVVLDGVQDPGNAGAIVRAAEAFGATGVVFLKGTVNPYNPNAAGFGGIAVPGAVVSGVGRGRRAPALAGIGSVSTRRCRAAAKSRSPPTSI